jgi:NAD(P)H-hydrate epimerase
MAGAAVLAARTALKSGAGLVQVSIEEPLWPIVQVAEPCATCVPRDIPLQSYQAIAIGPGLGKGGAGAAITARVLKEYTGKLIIDADALNIIAAQGSDFTSAAEDIIITPHTGEAARLLGMTTAEIGNARTDSVRKLAALCGGTAILKGYESLVCRAAQSASPGQDSNNAADAVCLNPTGNPGMATAGSGDVLTGLITAFTGMGLSAEDAAKAGVYIHGKAGDIAAARIGEYGITATDISNAVPEAIHSIQQHLPHVPEAVNSL